MKRSFACIPFFVAAALAPPALAETAQRRSTALNPDIGVNFLGLLSRGTNLSDRRIDVPRNGLRLQEAELQFTADVDPYLRATALFSVAQESGASDLGIDPEEVFLETLSLPVVSLKAGKFKLAFGRHNQLHTHAFPFIDAPLVHQELLGDEGIAEAGLSASALIPLPWFSEVTAQAFDPGNEAIFDSPRARDIGTLGRLRNLWDLSEASTIELGLSGMEGKNAADARSTAWAADLTFKWRPTEGGKYRSVAWSAEYVAGHRRGVVDAKTGESLADVAGAATWVQYQFAERWWAQARVERAGFASSEGIAGRSRQSLLLGLFPSEFSGIRLQYDHLATEGRGKPDHAIALQYNVSIGAHPAHAY